MCTLVVSQKPASGRGTSEKVPQTIYTDVCIYGGTSGGVISAVQVARSGKSAIVIESGRHVGGMTASGLSWTDVGSSERLWVLGGLAKEFYQRVGAHYGQRPDKVFQTPQGSAQVRGYDFAKPPSLSFEPHVAEAVFKQWLAESKVPVYYNGNLISVRKSKGRITEIITGNGYRVRAKVFLDATYEGDLMAMAGVSYTVGRESNSKYGETVNGIQGPASSARAGKFEVSLDPYNRSGDVSSGLLPCLLQDGEIKNLGYADTLVQSYNYRVCLTDNVTNRIPMAPPANYDASAYELLGRWIQARITKGENLSLSSFLKYDPLQNEKFDFNNRWAISTDFIGGANNYPEAHHSKRKEIALQHENYLRGFFYFLRTDPRVPGKVRDEMGRFGLCKDEFTDNGGWPHQLYVREARRMVSDLVMLEQHCVGELVAPKSIGMGAYGIDMHAVRRIVHKGQPVNEGTIGRPVPAPYPVGYDAIVPKASECENLLVTFAVSASHVAFGSIRMEPVFMILSHSAATAACLAIEKNISVQKVPYKELAERLQAEGQVLNSKYSKAKNSL